MTNDEVLRVMNHIVRLTSTGDFHPDHPNSLRQACAAVTALVAERDALLAEVVLTENVALEAIEKRKNAESALADALGKIAGLAETWKSEANCSGAPAGYRAACRHHATSLNELRANKERT